MIESYLVSFKFNYFSYFFYKSYKDPTIAKKSFEILIAFLDYRHYISFLSFLILIYLSLFYIY
jgi:hypothetical protein